MSAVSSEWKLSAIKQRFSLPEALLFYIAKNPSTLEVFYKLFKCCKNFWLKNPVITLKDLRRSYYDKYWRTNKINGFKEVQMFRIEDVEEKLWICQDVVIGDLHDQFLASSLIRKIFRCHLSNLDIKNQILSFDEFRKLTSSLKAIYLFKTSVKNNDGSMVPIEKLIESLPNLQEFRYYNVNTEDILQTITSETAAKLVAIPHFAKIQRITMEEISESFDIEAFFATPWVRTFFDCLISYLIN